ncbi:hypothetical protein F2P56_010257 [Juglans regia]|uniref:CCT-theta n=1 Tax=Juglans regia TaxID=51240 RepID=A0A834D2Q0_JUGRE|nr:hypothetical protein F2P56_010257 [Juglans regia]
MQPYGMQAMLKEGHKHLSGLDEAVLKNIDACKQLSAITRTSLGPNGMNKMVINHLDKLFVTNDAATIVNELEVQHPAAKILVLAGKSQQEEIGDGANLTISFAGELLQNAEELIRMGLHPSEIINGYTKAINKVAVFASGVDTAATETKGTVLIHTAKQLESYSKSEEAKVEELIKAVADSGAKVIVSGAAVGEMALHFCERYKLMVLKISSKFELRRFCRTAGAVAMLKLSPPNPDDLGHVDSISVEEIGGVRVTVVKNEEGGNSIATVILRGSTDSILDDLERAIDDGVNTYKAMCRDSRIVPGAAASEIELARRVKELSYKETG